MRYIGQFFLAVFIVFMSLSILSMFRNAVLDNGLLLLLSFLLPILFFFPILFARTSIKSLGWAFLILGLSLALMPIGMMELTDGLTEAVNEAQMNTVEDVVVKSVIGSFIASMGRGILLFGALGGLGFMFAAVILLRTRQNKMNTSFRGEFGSHSFE